MRQVLTVLLCMQGQKQSSMHAKFWKQGKIQANTCWLKASPSLSRVRMRSVFLETAQNPSGHCSDANPEA